MNSQQSVLEQFWWVWVNQRHHNELAGLGLLVRAGDSLHRRISLEMRCLSISPMPIGLTPGSFSNAIKRHAIKASLPWGSMNDVHNLLSNLARTLQRSLDALWKEQHILFQAFASRPEGPTAMEQMNGPSILS